MNTYKLKWTRLRTEIFRFLCIKAGQNFNLRGIAKFLSVSPTAVSNSLSDLKRADLIKIESSKTMNLMSIEFNRDNQKAIEFKRAENLRLIYESGIVNFLEGKFQGCTIILFGSYSKGEDTLNSDIDIAIIGTKGKEVEDELSNFDKRLERTINVNFYKSWNITPNLRNNILNGIVLRGSVEI